MVVLGIVLAVIVVLALLAISYKNKFVVLDNLSLIHIYMVSEIKREIDYIIMIN